MDENMQAKVAEGVAILESMAVLHGAGSYVQELARCGHTNPDVAQTCKDLAVRIDAKRAEWKSYGEEWVTGQRQRGLSLTVSEWRRQNHYALPPLTPRSVASGLPRLQAALTPEGGIQLRDTLSNRAVGVGDAVVVKPSYNGDPHWAGRRGTITRIALAAPDEAEMHAGKGAQDFAGVSVSIRTENGAPYAARAENMALDGDWAPSQRPLTSDPDGNALRQNPHWHIKPSPMPPWRLLAELQAADARLEHFRKLHQASPHSEDAHMFWKASEDHLRRAHGLWKQWAKSNPDAADELLDLHEEYMQTARLDIPLAVGALDYADGLRTAPDAFSHFRPSEIAKKTQDVVIGYAAGVVSDGVVTDTEVQGLESLMLQAGHDCPVLELLEGGIKKWRESEGRASDAERQAQLLDLLNKAAGGNLATGEMMRASELPLDSPPPAVNPQGTFLFTGTFSRGNRKACEARAKQFDGQVATSLSAKVDYLVIGDYVTPSWMYSTYGRKIQDAVERRDHKGQSISIISEAHWEKQLAAYEAG